MILKRENERRTRERRTRVKIVQQENIVLVDSFFSKLFSREFGLNVPKFVVRTIIRTGIPQFAGPKGRTAVSIRRELVKLKF